MDLLADPGRLRALIARAGPDELAQLRRVLEAESLSLAPLPHQSIPGGPWATWLIQAGRGAGKTWTGAYAMNAHALGPPCDRRLLGGHLMRIVGQTFTDAIAICYSGPSGLKSINPEVDLVTTKKGTVVRWPNRAEAYVFGASRPQDVDKQRGHASCFDWHDEKASHRYLKALDEQADFGHRIGAHPRRVITTTPKNRPEIHTLAAMARRWAAWRVMAALLGFDPFDPLPPRQQRVYLTRAQMSDNPNLAEEIATSLYDTYGGTRLGQQELLGELLDDLGTVFGSHWWNYRDEMPGWRAVRVWDFGATDADEGGDPDWTAGVRVSISPRAGYALERPDGSTQYVHEFNIDHVERGRWSPARVEEHVYSTARADGGNVKVLIEEERGSAGKHNVAHYRRLLAGIATVDGVSPSGPKPVRIGLLASVAEQGRVTLTRAGWNDAFRDEAEAYVGDDSEHDDQLDAAAYGIAVLEGRAQPISGRTPAGSGRLPPRTVRGRGIQVAPPAPRR